MPVNAHAASVFVGFGEWLPAGAESGAQVAVQSGEVQQTEIGHWSPEAKLRRLLFLTV